VAADISVSKVPQRETAVIPLGRATSARGLAATDRGRHDNPHWPVRSPDDAADALAIAICHSYAAPMLNRIAETKRR